MAMGASPSESATPPLRQEFFLLVLIYYILIRRLKDIAFMKSHLSSKPLVRQVGFMVSR